MQFAPVYPLLYKILKPTFPTCLWAGSSTHKQLALTFDDGPHPHHTPQLLEVLDRHQITANFFWIGSCVERSPAVAQSIWQRGHWVGLHGYEHHLFLSLSVDELKQSLFQTQAAIAQACQVDLAYVREHVRDVRPPVGVFTPQILHYFQQWRYRPVMWSVVPEDWVRPGVERVVQRIVEQTENGSLIVLHDGYYGGNDVAAIADQIIPHFLQQGYEFVTVDRLWQERQV